MGPSPSSLSFSLCLIASIWEYTWWRLPGRCACLGKPSRWVLTRRLQSASQWSSWHPGTAASLVHNRGNLGCCTSSPSFCRRRCPVHFFQLRLAWGRSARPLLEPMSKCELCVGQTILLPLIPSKHLVWCLAHCRDSLNTAFVGKMDEWMNESDTKFILEASPVFSSNTWHSCSFGSLGTELRPKFPRALLLRAPGEAGLEGMGLVVVRQACRFWNSLGRGCVHGVRPQSLEAFLH